MDILTLVAAFGGGAFGAAIGALPAFILTGVLAIVGGIAVSDGIIGFVAFGSFLGPHIAFAGGVAAAAYAKKIGKLENGADICTPLAGLGEPSVLIVGGIFGIIGYLIKYGYSLVFAGTVSTKLVTDLPGITVVTSAIIVRLVFGSTGLTGKYTGSEKRSYISTGKAMAQNAVIGLTFGLLVSGVGLAMQAAGADTTYWAVICFGIAAVGLVFAQTGFAFPTCHHIVLPAASAALMSGNIVAGAVVGVVCSILGDFFGLTFNSYNDSHIDPPACTIFFMTFVINAIWG